MKQLAIAAVILGLCGGAVSAQTMMPGDTTKPAGQETNQAECLRNFMKADADGNGTISVSEAERAPSVIPTDLGLSGPITQQEFLTSCEKRLPKGG